MRKLCCGSLAATVGLMLVGCVQQTPSLDPAAAARELSTGAPLLRCRAECLAQWRRAQPDAAQLDAAARWAELAALVISVNYQDDLTLYYLARAAEGLGYRTEAVGYYRQSTYISGTSLSCRYESGLCGGVILPNAALARIEALESQARRSRPHPHRHPVTGAKSAPVEPKPTVPAERRSRLPAAAEHEKQQPGSAEPEPRQSAVPAAVPAAAPVSQPGESAPAAEPTRSTVSERPDTGAEPPPPAPPGSPPPPRMDPVAKQYIEPPAAR